MDLNRVRYLAGLPLLQEASGSLDDLKTLVKGADPVEGYPAHIELDGALSAFHLNGQLNEGLTWTPRWNETYNALQGPKSLKITAANLASWSKSGKTVKLKLK